MVVGGVVQGGWWEEEERCGIRALRPALMILSACGRGLAVGSEDRADSNWGSLVFPFGRLPPSLAAF